MATNFLELATTLKYLGAKWLPGKKVNFTPCCLSPVWPGVDSWRHMLVEFVGSLLCTEGFFSGVLRFSPLLASTYVLI